MFFKSTSHMIKEALDVNEGQNPMANFLQIYYGELLRKADEHKKIVQTNQDEGFIQLHKKYGDSLDNE